MASPEVFARRIAKLAKGATRNVADIKADAAKRIGSTLVKTTPVDTTLARSNWVASGNTADLSLRTIRSAGETVADMVSSIMSVDSETDIHIANGGDKVPYLYWLNKGTSSQAPAGFVEESVHAGKRAVERGRVLKRRKDV
jgi:hypothetical protein